MKTIILLIITLLGFLPLSLRSALGRAMGFIFAMLPTRERTIARLQIEHFIGAERAPSLVREVFAGIGQTLFESFNLRPFLSHQNTYISSDDWPEAERLLAKKRGIVALTAHTGNWDLLAAYMVSRGIELCAVGREARNPTLQEILLTLRNQYGIQTIWRSDKKGIKEIIARLKGGQVVAALIDQDTRVKSEFSPFFGHPAATPSALVRLAKEQNFLLATAFIFRTGFNKYRVFMQPLAENLTLKETLDEYNRRLEGMLRRYPSQWVWFHKRWRTMPGGKRMSSKEYIEYLKLLLKKSAAIREL